MKTGTLRWWAVCVIVGLLLGTISGLLVNKALGAEKQCSFSNPDGGCYSPAQMAHKFEHHKIKRTDGIPVNKTFAHPAKAKKVIVAHTITYLKHHPKRIPAVKKSVAAYHAEVSKCCSIPTNWITQCHVVCLSGWAYARAKAKDNCAGDFLHNTVFLACTPGQTPMTTKQLEAGIGVTICSGLLVIGVVSAPATAGGGTVAMGAAAGGLSCGWSFFTAVQ